MIIRFGSIARRRPPPRARRREGGLATAEDHWPDEELALVDQAGFEGPGGEVRPADGEVAGGCGLQRFHGVGLKPLGAEIIARAELAQESLHAALDAARVQEARLLELRAAMSLARLWRDQGKVQQARELLAPVYGWFNEGFDTRDLKEAKALLEELAP